MNRRLLILVLAVLALGVVVGCEKTENITSTDPTEPTTSAEPDELALAASFPALLANGVDEVVIHATVVDSEGRGLPDIGVTFSSSHGTVTPFATTDAGGKAQATLTSEASSSDITATVTASAGTGQSQMHFKQGASVLLSNAPLSRSIIENAISAKRDGAGVVPLSVPMDAVQDVATVQMTGVTLLVSANPATIPADGISRSRIVANLLETTSRVPLQGQEIRFGASAGTITGRVMTDPSGSATAHLVGDPGETASEITVFNGNTLSATVNVSFSPLDLTLDSENTTIFADGHSSTEVRALLTNQQGNPVTGASIDFVTTSGTIASPITTDEDGLATTTLTSAAVTGTADVTARFGGALEQSLQVEFTDPPATAELLIQVEPATLPADGGSEAILRATALDDESNPMPDGTAVGFEILSGDGMIVGASISTTGGVAETKFVAGTATGPVTIQATSGPAMTTTQLFLSALEASSITLEADNAAILADGVAAARITATVRDAYGHPVAPGVAVTFETTLGLLSEATPTDESGISTVLLRADRFVTGTTRITATTGAAQATLDIDFVSEAAAHIDCVRVEPPSISIFGAGDHETATITFEVQDRNGIPVDSDHAVTLEFEIIPEGGTTDATVHPSSVTTNQDGLANATVNAGSIPGAVEVIATSGWLLSRPIRVAIHGGLPDPDHFSISFERLNIAGLVYDGIRNGITARVGDFHGNPVPDSTIVWFNAAYGLIQGSAGTNDHGEATVNEVTAGPRPLIPGGDGLVQICAQTVSRTGDPITVCGNVMWSGPTIVQVVSPSGGFNVPNGGSVTITYMVHDANFNPLVGGTSITVQATEGQLGGDVQLILPDTQSAAYTTFSAVLSDADVETDIAAAVTVTVNVTSVNGNATASITGTMN